METGTASSMSVKMSRVPAGLLPLYFVRRIGKDSDEELRLVMKPTTTNAHRLM